MDIHDPFPEPHLNHPIPGVLHGLQQCIHEHGAFDSHELEPRALADPRDEIQTAQETIAARLVEDDLRGD